MSRVILAAQLVQCRAYDGKKRSETDSIRNGVKRVEPWIENQISGYLRFKERVQEYPHHRRRLAYVVKVYAKGIPDGRN